LIEGDRLNDGSRQGIVDRCDTVCRQADDGPTPVMRRRITVGESRSASSISRVDDVTSSTSGSSSSSSGGKLSVNINASFTLSSFMSVSRSSIVMLISRRAVDSVQLKLHWYWWTLNLDFYATETDNKPLPSIGLQLVRRRPVSTSACAVDPRLLNLTNHSDINER